ncbi:hypothetical protein JAAARDRAFT_125410 [Jaapia argillacea MUCL 33604]|uniref:SNF7 family protein n=1 Tax=Jaapia argillacea MUCL 33604 TaxID=933084 RepID=A0A067Q1P1_9AGAM|nr:hypothetical protein JAAARDRAFT_125410 [Jaapia argillacea MUCL 33604]
MIASQLSLLPTYDGTSTSRLQSLYSDISRRKDSNPTAYRSSVDWWRQTLEAWLAKGWQRDSQDKLILHVAPNLVDSFKFEGVGKPLGLSSVVAELCNQRSLIPLTQFTTTTQSIYDPGSLSWRIASYVVGKPLWWALQQTGIVGSDDGGSESDAQRWKRVKGDYVVLSLLEQAAESVLSSQQTSAALSPADSLFNAESFRRTFASAALPDVTLSDADIKVLIKYLERDKKVVVADTEVIKFIDADTAEEQIVTVVDHGILELKSGVEDLNSQVESLQVKIKERNEKITAALRQKQKDVAMSYLRSRKQLEDILKKRLGSLEILQSTLLSVETAAGDVQIMKSYETSTSTLRAILSHPSLQKERIDETMDAMAAATADAREVDDAIRMGGDMAQTELGIDDDELEAELRALAQEANIERAEQEEMQAVREKQLENENRSGRIPAVPSTQPSGGDQLTAEAEVSRHLASLAV